MVLKKIAVVLTVVIITLSSAQSAYAYGGGGGFPPGFPPPPHVKLVCEYEYRTIRLPFNRTRIIRIPRCHVEITRPQNNQNDNKDFRDRWNEFIDRIRNGRK